MGKKKTRRKFTAEQKANIIRRHLKDKVPVSDMYLFAPICSYLLLRSLLVTLLSNSG
jgi:hypothetical protein